MKCFFAIQHSTFMYWGRSLEFPIPRATLTNAPKIESELKQLGIWFGLFPESALSYKRGTVERSFVLIHTIQIRNRILGVKRMITCMNAGGSGHRACVWFLWMKMLSLHIFLRAYLNICHCLECGEQKHEAESQQQHIRELSIHFVYDFHLIYLRLIQLCWK